MRLRTNDPELPYHSGNKEDPGGFFSLWPSDTAGDGRIVKNNRKTGGAQGATSFKLKVHCQNCGFLADLNRDDSSGGDLSGNGAIQRIDSSTETITLSNGTTFTETRRNSASSKGGGCPLCGSKNYAAELPYNVQQVEPIPKIGF